MNCNNIRSVVLLFALVLVFACNQEDPSYDQPLFETIPASHSGIDFANNLKEDVSTLANVLDFDFFYNGAGVGAGDFNNDGLLDIFFAGNQVGNKLYINKGDFHFEDISTSAGIEATNSWCNGVSIVDINQDGFLDIYVSVGGPEFDEDNRKNLLFINQQDLTFKEVAEDLGLADNGFSTQTLFFDYDLDGDVDCLVGNESYLYGYAPIDFYQRVATDDEVFHKNSSHFYRNDGGQFVDVSKESGVLRPSFSLGLVCHDFNEDGLLDFYQSNDYFIPDVLYINKGDGSFEDQTKNYFKQLPYFGMGLDVADINNDAKDDLFVLDMASSDHVRSKTLMKSMDSDHFYLLVKTLQFPYQYMFNAFQLNDGHNKYINTANAFGMAKTDWSWTALLSDFDNDGLKDVFVTNGYRRYALDNDFTAKVDSVKQLYNNDVPLNAKQAIYDQMPVERLSNLMYKNQGNLKFSDNGQKWGVDLPGFSNGAVQGDFDNDGDLDLVINNIDDVATIYRNTSSKNNYLKLNFISEQADLHSSATIFAEGVEIKVNNKAVRGYLSSSVGNNIVGLGHIQKIDSVIVKWPGNKIQSIQGVAVNSELTVVSTSSIEGNKLSSKENIFQELTLLEGGEDIKHTENDFNDYQKEILLPYKQSTIGPALKVGDLDNDGDDDLVFTGARNRPSSIYYQENQKLIPTNAVELLRQAPMEDVGVEMLDIDQDGYKEIYFARGGNEIADPSPYYRDAILSTNAKGINSFNSDNIGAAQFSGKVVKAIDFDNDGDDDLLVGNRIIPQKYPIAAESFIYKNENGKLVDVTQDIATEFGNFGIVNDIEVLDIDNDGDTDFIAVAEWGTIGIFENSNGTFTNIADRSNIQDLSGLWLSVNTTDFNNDGLADLIVGNLGLNSKFKASREKPFKVYAEDFDQSGSLDIVLSTKYKDKYVPVRGRECSSEQMPFIADKFEDYSSFANADIHDIYGDDIESKAYSKSVNELQSVFLINKGNGVFEPMTLPNEVQLFPLQDVISYDVDANGYEDLIMAGGIYDMEVETPRLDGGQGIILLNDGKSYVVASDQRYRLHFDGDVKDMDMITIGDKDILLVARNNDDVLAFHIRKD